MLRNRLSLAIRHLAFVTSCVSLLSSVGCVHDRSWQPLGKTVPAPAFTVTLPADPAAVQKSPSTANHATVEFLSHGDYADDCKGTTYKKPCQLRAAIDFIHNARELADTDPLVVLTFIHGNENNASYEHSDNYPHFEQLLDCLNRGKDDYKTANAALLQQGKVFNNKPLDCDGFPPKAGNVKYIGIYIGWRGRFNDTPINVAQAGGMRIGKSRNIIETLFSLRNAAKDGENHPPARFIVIGHSFGGLLLEQASSRIYQAAMNSGDENIIGACDTEKAERGLKPFSDLVITLNEAVNGVPAKHLIDAFQSTKLPLCHSSQLAPALNRPLLVAVHSKSDAFWTGKTATVLRRFVWWPNGGHDLGQAFPEEDMDGTHPNKLLVYFSTPPNMTYYTNICYDDAGVPMTNCQAVENLAHFDLSKGYARAFPNLAVSSSTPARHLLVRFRCNSSVLPTDLQVRYMEDCKATDPSNEAADLHIWNTSPYWLFAVNDDVISGHNFFWGPKLLSLVEELSSISQPLSLDQVLPVESASAIYTPTP